MEYSVIYASRRLTADRHDGAAGDTRGQVLQASVLQASAPLAASLYQPARFSQFYAPPSLLLWRAGPSPDG